MFATLAWMRFALICNFVGGVVLFFSFQLATSSFRLVQTNEGDMAICGNRKLLIQTKGSNLMIGGGCPNWEQGKSIAIVYVERSWLVVLGLGLTVFGFALQLLALPRSEKSLPDTKVVVKNAPAGVGHTEG